MPNPLEIQPEEFLHHESEIHGRSHIHRVMFWTKKVCIAQGLRDIQADVLCAARLHDLARKHDGQCLVHGAMATTLLNRYEPLFRELGAKDMEAIEYAVAVHCLPTPLDHKHPHYLTAAALRDADALDRFRLNEDGPNPKYLHFERTPNFFRAAQRLFDTTGHDNELPLATIIEIGEEVSNPAKGTAAKTPDRFDESETPRKRRNRRLLQGQFAGAMKTILENLEDYAIASDLNKVIHRLPSKEKGVLTQAITSTKLFASQFLPVTYIQPASLQTFQEERCLKSVWELDAPTWHTTFSENTESVLDARAYNDSRLWGEKGRWLAHGALIIPEDYAVDTRLREMYGSKRITWKKNVLEGASFCVNDSQENAFCLPIEVFPETIMRQMLGVLCRTMLRMPELIRLPDPFPDTHLQFIELQIHKKLTPEDIQTIS